MGAVGWIALFAGFAIVLAIVGLVRSAQQQSAMEAKLASLKGFKASQKIFGVDAEYGIAIDEKRNKLCLLRIKDEDVVVDVFSCGDVISSEIFEDGNTLTKTPRLGQYGSVAMGKLLYGEEDGAIIGGLSADTVSSQTINRIDLRITVNDSQSPNFDFNFLDTETPKNGIIYEDAAEKARHWHGLVSVLIHRAKQEESAGTADAGSSKPASVSDEIRKLAKLRDEGLISDEEFSTQKARLLK